MKLQTIFYEVITIETFGDLLDGVWSIRIYGGEKQPAGKKCQSVI